jgi:hypothetical protein
MMNRKRLELSTLYLFECKHYHGVCLEWCPSRDMNPCSRRRCLALPMEEGLQCVLLLSNVWGWAVRVTSRPFCSVGNCLPCPLVLRPLRTRGLELGSSHRSAHSFATMLTELLG